MSSLDVKGVSVNFAGRPVLDNISLHVPTGEIYCLTGASGSGKSTLLRVIAGLRRPDNGVIMVDGVDITALRPHQRHIGLVFQDQGLFPHLDVGANVGFALRIARWAAPKRTARVQELLELVGLHGFDGRDVASLSGGEAQRVALARALAAQPAVLLLDEPLAALDPAIHDRLAADLRGVLKASATTALHVTHDVAEAQLIGDHTVALADLSGAGPR